MLTVQYVVFCKRSYVVISLICVVMHTVQNYVKFPSDQVASTSTVVGRRGALQTGRPCTGSDGDFYFWSFSI